MAVCN